MSGFNYIIEHLPLQPAPLPDVLGESAIWRYRINVGEQVKFDNVGELTLFTLTDQASLDGMMAALSVIRAGTVSGAFESPSKAYIDCQVYQIEEKTFHIEGSKRRSMELISKLPFDLTGLQFAEWLLKCTALYPFIPIGVAKAEKIPVPPFPFPYLHGEIRFFANTPDPAWCQPRIDMTQFARMSFSRDVNDSGSLVTMVSADALIAHASPMLRLAPGVYEFDALDAYDTYLELYQFYLVVASFPPVN